MHIAVVGRTADKEAEKAKKAQKVADKRSKGEEEVGQATKTDLDDNFLPLKHELLELFSGTGSVGRAFAEKGWVVISLDSDPKTDATIHGDILKWDYSTYPPGHFDVIWASPCCQRAPAEAPKRLVIQLSPTPLLLGARR